MGWSPGVAAVAVVAAVASAAAPGPAEGDPSATAAYNFDPPSWYRDGVRLIKKRGGTCKRTSEDGEGRGQTLHTEDQSCDHRIPNAVAKEFGQNPRRGESCHGGSADVQGDPEPPRPGIPPPRPVYAYYSYTCRVFARPGTNKRPNRASWPCLRRKYRDDYPRSKGGLGVRNDKFWTAERTRLYRKQRFTTLRRCLNPRLRRRR
jgi:hypothetical protein